MALYVPLNTQPNSLLKFVSSMTTLTLVKTTGAQLFSLRHPSLLIKVRRALGHSLTLLRGADIVEKCQSLLGAR